MNDLISYITANPAAVNVAVAWLVREWHLQWPRLVAIYPYVKANGGLIRIIADFFYTKAPVSTGAAKVGLIGLLCLMGLTGHAQVATNAMPAFAPVSFWSDTTTFYPAASIDIELTANFSAPSILANAKNSYGYSLETEYWTTKYTGTGLEIGSYNYQNLQVGGIDHVSVMEDFRLVPFEGRSFWNRFAFEGKTGAETSLLDGAKGILLGGEIDFALTHNFVAEADLTRHWIEVPHDTVRAGLKLRF